MTGKTQISSAGNLFANLKLDDRVKYSLFRTSIVQLLEDSEFLKGCFNDLTGMFWIEF